MPLAPVQDPTVSLETSALEPYLVSLKRNIFFIPVIPLCYSLSSLCFLSRLSKNSVFCNILAIDLYISHDCYVLIFPFLGSYSPLPVM